MRSLARAVVCICVLFSFPSVGTGAPFAYITNTGSNTVSVIDTATNTVVKTVRWRITLLALRYTLTGAVSTWQTSTATRSQ